MKKLSLVFLFAIFSDIESFLFGMGGGCGCGGGCGGCMPALPPPPPICLPSLPPMCPMQMPCAPPPPPCACAPPMPVYQPCVPSMIPQYAPRCGGCGCSRKKRSFIKAEYKNII